MKSFRVVIKTIWQLALCEAVVASLCFGGLPSEAFAAKSKSTRKAKQTKQREFKMDRGSRWELIEFNHDEATGAESTTLQRNVWSSGVYGHVATVTQTVVPRDSKQGILTVDQRLEEATKLATLIRNSVNGPEWSVEKMSDKRTFVFRADWKNQNRFVQILYKDLGHRTLISTSVVRRLYIFPIAGEMVAVQKYMAGRVKLDTAWLESFRELWNEGFFVPKAHAQTNFTDLIGIGFEGNRLVTGVNQTGINQTLRGVGGELDLIAGNLQGRATNTVNTALGRVDQTVNATMGRVDQSVALAGKTANASIDYAYQKAKQLTSPHNLFMGGLYAAAGGAIGYGIANFVLTALVDGSVALASSLWHAAMGTMPDSEKKEMHTAVTKAFSEMESSGKKLIELEVNMDRYLGALAAIGNVPADTMSEIVSMALFMANENLTNLKQKYRSSRSAAEQQQCLMGIPALEKRIRELEELQKFLINNGRQSICDKLDQMFNEWNAAESSLHNARMIVTQNGRDVLNEIQKRLFDSNKRFGGDRSQNNYCNEYQSRFENLRSDTQASTQCVARYLTGPADAATQAQVKAQCDEAIKKRLNAYLAAMRQTCADAKATYAGVDLSASLANGMQLATANMQSAQRAIDDISRADCEEGVQVGVCNGQAGAFSRIRNSYEKHYQVALNHCPNIYRPPILDEPQIGPIAAAGAPGAVVTPLASPDRSASDGPNIFERFGNWASRLYYSIFG